MKLESFVNAINKSKYKKYMTVGDTVVDKKIETEEENIKDKGEPLDTSRLEEIRKQKENLLKEKEELTKEEESKIKLERKK